MPRCIARKSVDETAWSWLGRRIWLRDFRILPTRWSRRRLLAEARAEEFRLNFRSCETIPQARPSVWRGASRLWHDSLPEFWTSRMPGAREGLLEEYGAAESVRRRFENRGVRGEAVSLARGARRAGAPDASVGKDRDHRALARNS